MIEIFDSLPDAVLLTQDREGRFGEKHFDLLYCNQPADNLYKTNLSKLDPDEL